MCQQRPQRRARGVGGVTKVVRVFEVVSDAELADFNRDFERMPASRIIFDTAMPAAPSASGSPAAASSRFAAIVSATGSGTA